ncbi:hypothetical protein [Spiroplasma eriocheiris]|nr:hypothetical protein [Spiroplasma eriocheiris]AHF57503.1 hypothetical protein SPE_0374 [Spiroplasma eriocheiris CCTCC M 207170]AKM53960.1 hypothetical protein SERIO_v1c03800 [Spiroplasma eriocheiris]
MKIIDQVVEIHSNQLTFFGDNFEILPFGDTVFQQVRCESDNLLLFKYYNNIISIKCKSCKQIHYINVLDDE